jgi:hypothetical protein
MSDEPIITKTIVDNASGRTIVVTGRKSMVENMNKNDVVEQFNRDDQRKRDEQRR